MVDRLVTSAGRDANFIERHGPVLMEWLVSACKKSRSDCFELVGLWFERLERFDATVSGSRRVHRARTLSSIRKARCRMSGEFAFTSASGQSKILPGFKMLSGSNTLLIPLIRTISPGLRV